MALKRSLTALYSIFFTSVAAGNAWPAESPNIILINLDDVGTGWIPPYADRITEEDIDPVIVQAYSQSYGRGTPVDLQRHIEAARSCMPYLSRLAKEGAVFDRGFATSALCAPSRAGLLTGTFQQRWGAYWNVDVDDHGIPADLVVLAEPLSAAGYHCGMIGKWHVAKKDDTIKERIWVEQLGETLPIPAGSGGRWPELREHLRSYAYYSSSAPGQHPLDRGFDYYFGFNHSGTTYYRSNYLWENHDRIPERPDGEFLTDLFNDKACEFIRSALEKKGPFFLYYAPLTVHGPLNIPPPEHYSSRFDTGVGFSNQYAGHLLALDNGIKMIYEILEEFGQAKNTLFVFTSDNGCTAYNVPPHNAPNRGGKGTGWLGGINVPLIVWHADLVKPGIYQDMVSLVDVMPTVLDASGIPGPSGIDGKSLLPFLSGNALSGPRKDLVLSGIHASRWSYFYEGNGEKNDSDGRSAPLYACYLSGDRVLMRIAATKPGLYKALPDGLPARTLLFDLSSDRHQLNDISAQYPEQVRTFDSAIRKWLGEMKPPLISQQDDYRKLMEE